MLFCGCVLSDLPAWNRQVWQNAGVGSRFAALGSAEWVTISSVATRDRKDPREAPRPARARKAPPAPAAQENPLPAGARHLCQLYQLGAAEQRLLEFLLGAGAALAPTLGEARAALSLADGELLEVLLPGGVLRAHALVETDEDAALGLLREGDRLYPARGLRQAWYGSPGDANDIAVMEGQAPGCEYLPAPAPETAWAQELLAERPPGAIAELVREHLLHPPRAPLLWLGGCTLETARGLSRALCVRLARPVLLLDGAALAGWPFQRRFVALQRLRRDADLRGAAVVAHEVHGDGAWRSLCAARPRSQTAPVLLCQGGAARALGAPPRCHRTGASLAPRAVDLGPPPAVAAGVAAPPAAPPDELASASREEARRKAALDAARAMGRPLPPEFLQPPAPAEAPPRPDPAPAPARQYPPAVARPPAPAVAPEPAAPSAPEAPPPGESAAAPDPAAAAEPATAAPEVPPAAEGPEPDPLPLADEAPVDEVARVARSSPNAQQRIALLRRLAGVKHPGVILSFRHNVGSPHAGVRAAAEAGMVSLFGPEWNRSRSIAPPVQPPRSDDGGRGPGGAV